MTTLENPLMMFCVLGVMMKMIKSMPIKKNGKQMTNITLISPELMCSYKNQKKSDDRKGSEWLLCWCLAFIFGQQHMYGVGLSLLTTILPIPLLLLYYYTLHAFLQLSAFLLSLVLTVFTVPTEILNLFIYLSNAQRALHLPVA